MKDCNIIHLIEKRKYVCNGAYSITKEKSTKDIFNVSCKNCLREIFRKFKLGKISMEFMQCPKCKKPFKNGYDKITKQISPYIFAPTCKCMGELRMMKLGG